MKPQSSRALGYCWSFKISLPKVFGQTAGDLGLPWGLDVERIIQKSCDVASSSFLDYVPRRVNRIFPHTLVFTKALLSGNSAGIHAITSISLKEVSTMTTEELQSQSGYEDGQGGPGAPTPLSALEVNASILASLTSSKLTFLGHQWIDTARH